MTQSSSDQSRARPTKTTGAEELPTPVPPDQLREQLRRLDGGFGDPALREYHTTGLPPLDDRLPGGGLPGAAITETFGGIGSGRHSFLLSLIHHQLAADEHERTILLIDRPTNWYAPAIVRARVPLRRLLVVNPGRQTDALWAVEQGLRSPTISLVVASVPWMQPGAMRRLQLAAEAGGGETLAVLLRPDRERGTRAAGAVQLGFQALPLPESCRETMPHARATRVQIHRCRGGLPGDSVDLLWLPGSLTPRTLPRSDDDARDGSHDVSHAM